MLINLTNHPSAAWGIEQLHAANEKFGHVVDVPFPVVPSTATAKEVAALVTATIASVDDLFEEQARLLADEDVLDSPEDGVHLMGETSFVVEFALQWHANEVKEPLYCSTTERDAETLPDGSIRRVFRFVQFRPMGGR